MSDTLSTTAPSGLSLALGEYAAAVEQTRTEMRKAEVVSRLWARDHTIWQPDPAEIVNRLGWLESPEVMRPHIAPMRALASSVRADGYTHVLLLGMGGSSLAPEVFRKIFGRGAGCCDLAVLDSTDPGAVLAATRELDPERTLFIVSTKSGGTVETLSFFKYAYNRTVEALGSERAGAHFVAITDPGSSLVDSAARYGFRETFLNDPNIGGRYSGLSFFGLVPATLTGADVETLLARARQVATACRNPNVSDNPGAALGTAIGTLAQRGRDKLTFAITPAWASFGDWIEQLIAESTGKNGTGILPVIGETIGDPETYGPDRVFVHLRLDGDTTHDAALTVLRNAGHPVIRLDVRDAADLGGQFFLWEFATAVAGWCLGINPFDQPDVESAKIQARTMLASYQRDGRLPELPPTFTDADIAVRIDGTAQTVRDALTSFVDAAAPGDYIATQAYLPPTASVAAALADLRDALHRHTRCATTVGYGPRFLHSTGQLHKGDRGKGLFIQITTDIAEDLAIPDEAGQDSGSVTFGTLLQAQAMGDAEALRAAGRRLIQLHIRDNVLAGIRRLSDSIG